MSCPIDEKLEESNLWQKFSHALKEISKDPMSMRGVLMGAVNIINALALAIFLSPTLQALKTGLQFTNKTIRILQIGSTLEKWSFYKMPDPLTFVRDVTAGILTAAAIPQFLDFIKVISLARFTYFLSIVPVIGFLAVIPFIPLLNVAEIFVNAVDGLSQGRDLHHVVSGKYLADCQNKVKKWKQAAIDLKAGINPILLLTDKQYKKLEKIAIEDPENALTAEEIKITTQTDHHKRINKWENKIAKLDERKKSKIGAIVFHISMIAMLSFLTLGMFVTSPVVPVALVISGLSVFTISLSKFVYNSFHPPVESIRFKPIRLT